MTTALPFASEVVDSPLGAVLLVGSDLGVCALRLDVSGDLDATRSELSLLLCGPIVDASSPITHKAARQVQAFLRGERELLTFPLDLRGTPFQRRVWEALSQIPFAETRSYQRVAAFIGKPKSVRAVANACGANPIPLAVPCHRVIGADGGLGGFTGGVALKRRLLVLERGSGDHLPLFELADSRDAEAQRTQRRSAALEDLPRPLAQWLQSHLDDEPNTLPMTAEAWVAEVLETLEGPALARLTETIAPEAAKGTRRLLKQVAEELVAAGLTLALAEGVDPGALGSLLRASAVLDSPFFEVTCRRIIGRKEANAQTKEAVLAVLRQILEGELPTQRRLKERSVDLWTQLAEHDPTSVWGAATSDDPSAAYAAHGLWTEAAIMAENSLAMGHGDPVTLLQRLAHVHSELGDRPAAYDAMLRLVALAPTSERKRQLRDLADTL